MKLNDSEPVNVINREVVGGTLNVTTSATTVTTDTMENYSEAEAKYELSTKSSVPSISKLPTEVSDVKGTESLDVVADDTKAGEDDFDYYDEIHGDRNAGTSDGKKSAFD